MTAKPSTFHRRQLLVVLFVILRTGKPHDPACNSLTLSCQPISKERDFDSSVSCFAVYTDILQPYHITCCKAFLVLRNAPDDEYVTCMALFIRDFRLRCEGRLFADFNVAIVGGGMCGILCAIALLRAEERIQFDLFESASAFTEVGAGVALGPNTAPILEELEVFSLIVAYANTSRLQMPYSFIDGDGENRRLYGYHPKPGAPGLSIYRPAYLEALSPLLPKESVHFNKRCVQIESIDGRRYVLHFADGTSHEADVVIGADGIKSVTREFITEHSNKENTVFTNTVAYRGLAPLEDLKKDGLHTDVTTSVGIWTSKDRHLVTAPIKGGKVLNIVAFHSDHSIPVGAVEVEGPSVEPAEREALFDAYTGCGPDVLTMLRHIENPSKWSLSMVHPPLETFWRERVVVIGDAAHGMLPHLGAGAGQALEDGYALAKLLSHPHINKSNIEEALRLYDNLRVARANRVAARSTQSGDIYDGYGEPGRSLRDQVEDQWEFVWNYDVTTELRQAVLTWN